MLIRGYRTSGIVGIRYICLHEPIDSREDVLMARDIIQAAWSVFLDPGKGISDITQSKQFLKLTMANYLELRLADQRHSSFFHWRCRS